MNFNVADNSEQRKKCFPSDAIESSESYVKWNLLFINIFTFENNLHFSGKRFT